MNWIDGVVIAVWVVVAILGFRRGLLQSAAILAVVGGGVAFSSRVAEPVGNLLSPVINNGNIQSISALLVVSAGVVVVTAILVHLLNFLRAYWRDTKLFGFNRLGGVVLGSLVASVLLSVALTGAQHYPVADIDGDIDDSTLGSFLSDGFDVVIRGIGMIPSDWDQKSDSRNRAALAQPPQLFRPPAIPSNTRHIAEHYAPIVFMDTAQRAPEADYLTTWDYDVDQDLLNNWNRLYQDGVDLRGHVYYWVLETEDHWYVGYGFFHPRDWGGRLETIECTGDDEAIQSVCHENDMEGMLLTVQKFDDAPYGRFLTMETVAHSDVISFKDYDASPSREVSGHLPICDVLGGVPACDVQFLEGTSHPYVYIEAKGHATSGAGRWERNFPEGDGVLYSPTGVAEVPSGGDDRTTGYDLVDIASLWDIRGQSSIFTNEPDGVGGNFLGNDGSNNAASPPWRWVDDDFPQFGSGFLFLDPARWINEMHNALVPWPVDYPAILQACFTLIGGR